MKRVQNLKVDLQDWRGKLDDQVSNYRSELSQLREALNVEVDELRKVCIHILKCIQYMYNDVEAKTWNSFPQEFKDLRGALKEQLEATATLASIDDPVDLENMKAPSDEKEALAASS